MSPMIGQSLVHANPNSTAGLHHGGRVNQDPQPRIFHLKLGKMYFKHV